MFYKTPTWQTLERQGGAERGFIHLKWEGSVGIFKFIETNLLSRYKYFLVVICWREKNMLGTVRQSRYKRQAGDCGSFIISSSNRGNIIFLDTTVLLLRLCANN